MSCGRGAPGRRPQAPLAVVPDVGRQRGPYLRACRRQSGSHLPCRTSLPVHFPNRIAGISWSRGAPMSSLQSSLRTWGRTSECRLGLHCKSDSSSLLLLTSNAEQDQSAGIFARIECRIWRVPSYPGRIRCKRLLTFDSGLARTHPARPHTLRQSSWTGHTIHPEVPTPQRPL